MRTPLALLCVLALLVGVAVAPTTAAQGIVYDPGSEWYRPGSDWLGATSTPSGVLDWSRSWSEDWTTGTSTPVPDVECVSAGASGDLTCTGAVATKSGNPTTVGAPGYPARTAVRLDGTGDYFTLGSVAVPDGSFSVRFAFYGSPNSGEHLIAQWESGAQSWSLYLNGTNLTMIVAKAGGGTSSLAIGTATNALNVVAASYEFVADGSSRIRANLNGVAPAEVTNAVGPALAGNILLSAGKNGYAAVDIISLGFERRSFTAAELAALVASQQARLAAKPLGALVTVTSGATTCDSRGDGSLYSLPAASLCCGASGCEVWGAAQHSNALANSTDIAATPSAWADDVGVSAADASEIGPSGTNWYAVTSTTARKRHYSTVIAGTAAVTLTSWMRAPTGTSSAEMSVSYAVNAATCTCGRSDGGSCATGMTAPTTQCHAEFAVSATPFVGWITATPASASNAYPALSGGSLTVAGTAWFNAPRFQASPVPGPYSPTAGTPFTGAADVPTVACTIPSVSRWALGLAAKPAGGWATANTGLLQWGGTYGAANSVSLYVDASAKLILEVFDAAGTPDWKRWTSTDALTGTTEKKIIVVNVGGSWTVYVDGVTVAGALSGTGTGLQTALPTTNTVSVGTSGSSKLNGAARKVCYERDYATCRKDLQ